MYIQDITFYIILKLHYDDGELSLKHVATYEQTQLFYTAYDNTFQLYQLYYFKMIQVYLNTCLEHVLFDPL
jgi:hypothetical protein